MDRNGELNGWKGRIIMGSSVGDPCPPEWLAEGYAAFRANVLDSRYPCYFGSQAERNGALYYSYIEGAKIDHLPATLRTFLDVCTDIEKDKNNLVVWFQPEVAPGTPPRHRTIFWSTLQYLFDQDPDRAAALHELKPSDPFWEFPFAGRLFFVVGISPAYRSHRSRNLGPSLMMVFQPREVFQDGKSGNDLSAEVRETIRNRARLFDGVPSHPDLNAYGTPGNREWSQYFISDDNSRETGRCPLVDHASVAAPDEIREPPPPSELRKG